MQDPKDELISQLLEQRDRMYREIRRGEERIAALEAQSDGTLLKQKESELAAQARAMAQKDRTIRELEDRITSLEGQVAWLKRKM